MHKDEIVIAELPPLDDDERDDACYRGRDRAWATLVRLFDQYNREQGLTYEALGKRIRRSRSQVQRWLSSSFNMNLKSLGLLAEGLDAELIIEVRARVHDEDRGNYCHPQEAARALVAQRIFATAATSASTTLVHLEVDHGTVSTPTSIKVRDMQVHAHADA